ncbi:large-conductance mechanosensitive channel protein MscL [Alicyclobacillaceae bacterium I2511]|nr:large-conductance mechanosensitive channel protein MscL [Alicyclobacillaceae bacterium I2511]
MSFRHCSLQICLQLTRDFGLEVTDTLKPGFGHFIASGNVLDWATGIVVGTAFSKVIESLVNDVIVPPLSLIFNQVDFHDLYVNLSGRHFATLSEAKTAASPTLNYGSFAAYVLDFFIESFMVYVAVTRLTRGHAKSVQQCPYCAESISLQAIRCPHCRSDLPPASTQGHI